MWWSNDRRGNVVGYLDRIYGMELEIILGLLGIIEGLHVWALILLGW